MRLAELKEKTFEQWKRHCWFKQVVIQPELFKQEIRSQFGDLRKRSTWESALCRFKALNSQIGLVDAYTLITSTFNYNPDRWDYDYRYRIFEEFLTLPDSIELIKIGLEQLFSSDFTTQERQEANGFFELVRETRRGDFAGIPTGVVRQLVSTS